MTPERIKSIRVRLGLTQDRFAALIGLRKSMICRLERGTRLPTPMTVAFLQRIESEVPVKQ